MLWASVYDLVKAMAASSAISEGELHKRSKTEGQSLRKAAKVDGALM